MTQHEDFEEHLKHAGVKGMKWGKRKAPPPGGGTFQPVNRQQAPPGGGVFRPVKRDPPPGGGVFKPVRPTKPALISSQKRKKEAKRVNALVSASRGNSFVRRMVSDSASTPLSQLRNRGTKESLGEKFASRKIDMNDSADFATQVLGGLKINRR